MKANKMITKNSLIVPLMVMGIFCVIPVTKAAQGTTLITFTKTEVDRLEFASFCETGFMTRENPEELEDTEECAVTEPGDFDTHEDLPLLFTLILICAWGALVRAIARHFRIKIPYTVLLLISGFAIGGLSHIESWCPTISKYTAIARMSPKHVLYTFLPILIFESAFSITVHTFIRSFWQIFILAFPGMVICSFGTAYLCWQFFAEYKWTFLHACLFGCIVSATDPVAVVSILRDLGVSEQLGVVIDGESLMNDGVAILMFELFHEFVVASGDEEHEHGSIGSIALHVCAKFAQIAFGGPVWGWIIGRITIFLLSYVYNDVPVEISATLCASYLTYWSSEYVLGVSGVIAVVVLGLTLGAERTVISPESEGPVHHFWEMLGYLANTVLFVLVGIVISETAVQHFGLIDFQYLFLLYIGLHVVRLLMLMMFYPILKRLGYGLPWQNMIVIMWGGLRGAVGMCLAIEIYQDEHLCQLLTLGPKILFHTAGITLLTLVVNGTTTKGLLQTLKLTEVTVGQKDEMNNAVRRMRKCKYNMIKSFEMATRQWMVDSRWDLVEKIVKIENPYDPPTKLDPTKVVDAGTIQPPRPLKDNTTVCWNCEKIVENEPTVIEYREITNFTRLRAIKSMMVHYHHLFEKGTLTEQATQLLSKDAELAEDKYLTVIQAQNFHKYMQVHGFYKWLRDKIIVNFKLHKDEELPAAPAQKWRYPFYWVATRDWFDVISFTVITFNMIIVIWDVILIYTSDYNHDQCKWTPKELRTKHAFVYTNYVFAVYYTLELLINLIGLGFKIYFCNLWHYLDIVVLIVTYADIYLYEIALKPEICYHDQALQYNVREYLNIIKGLRLLQFIRSLKLLRPLVPIILRKIRRHTNYQIFIGYDMGKGFVETSDVVIKLIPQMSENKKVQHAIKHAMKRERNACSQDLALIHSKFPGVAVALKTRHACRAVLNEMSFALRDVKNGGLLDDPDSKLLKHILEEKMKRLTHSPTFIQPTRPIGPDPGFQDDDEAKRGTLVNEGIHNPQPLSVEYPKE